MSKYQIIIDVMGSDNGPTPLVEGAIRALSQNPELSVVLSGDKSLIEEAIALALQKHNLDQDTYASRIEVLHASDVITNYDNPMEAIFRKTDSSLIKALTALGEREELVGLISAGNTGALLAGSLRYVPQKELKRPALAAILPAEAGGFTCLVDTGASIDCTAQQLVTFAHMGSAFMTEYYGIAFPRVGLLSNGAEETKGNKVVKETHALLKGEEGINFVGNIEANRALSGDCDVLVADGFAGNQVFKSAEGIARRIITDIVRYAKREGKPELMALVGHLMGIYDFSALGGGIVLGAGKPIIKARGTADDRSIVSTAEMLLNMAKNQTLFFGKDER